MSIARVPATRRRRSLAPGLVRASVRHLARHPWQTGLAVMGIALGVAVVVAIDLANESARRAFALSAEAVTGRATHQVTGGPAGLDEAVYVRLVQAGVRPAAPVVEADVGHAAEAGRSFRLLGVDPLAEAPFRPYLESRSGDRRHEPTPPGLTRLLTEPGAALLAEPTARDLGLSPGATLAIRVSGRRHALTVVGLMVPGDAASRQALAGLLVTDVATAQEVLGTPGRLSRIDLRLTDGPAGAAALAVVRAALPPGAAVEPAAGRSAFLADVTRAFSVNLAALSLLALLVGMLLIYNTAAFSVVQRRAVIARLRALGVTRGEILATLLLEAALVGVVASGLGLLAGTVLARGLVRLVTRTINDLYFVVAVRELWLSPLLLAKGGGLGLGATLLAALAPALEATGTPPGLAVARVSLEQRARRAAPRAALAGGAILAAGVLALALPTRGLVAGYLALFAVMVGAALLAPGAVVLLARGARAVLGRIAGVPGRLVAGGIVASLSRTGVAVAALMVAVAATIGVGLMVGSFRTTVGRWLESSLVADVYVSAPTLHGTRADSALDAEVVARLVGLPGVAAAGTYRGVRVGSALGPVQLIALGISDPGYRQFRFLAGDPGAIWPAFQEGGAVLVSEPFAYRHRLGVGDRLRVRTDRGERDLPVGAVYADYGSDQGVVMVSRRTYEALWDDRGVSSVSLVAAPGTSPAVLAATARATAGEGQELLVRETRALREASLQIFDRTFAITGVLRLLTMGVAFLGVLGALMALALERGRELAVLRTQGLTPVQVWAVVMGETGLLGLAAGLLAVPTGVGLAVVLIRVINRRSFGWTLPTVIEPAILLEGLGLAVAAALLAGLYPALRMARTPPALALREE